MTHADELASSAQQVGCTTRVCCSRPFAAGAGCRSRHCSPWRPRPTTPILQLQCLQTRSCVMRGKRPRFEITVGDSELVRFGRCNFVNGGFAEGHLCSQNILEPDKNQTSSSALPIRWSDGFAGTTSDAATVPLYRPGCLETIAGRHRSVQARNFQCRRNEPGIRISRGSLSSCVAAAKDT